MSKHLFYHENLGLHQNVEENVLHHRGLWGFFPEVIVPKMCLQIIQYQSIYFDMMPEGRKSRKIHAHLFKILGKLIHLSSNILSTDILQTEY